MIRYRGNQPAGLLWLVAAMVLGATGRWATAANLGYEFTFQGELLDDDAPVTGTCDFQFVLWDAATGGAQVGAVEDRTLEVTDGKFTTNLDFSSGAGGVFNGEARWIEMHVCCTSPCAPNFTTLDPRQKVSPAPYALALPGLITIHDIASPSVIGGSIANSVTDGVLGATIGGGGDPGTVGPIRVTDDFGTVAGGNHNRAGDNAGTTSDAPYATVGGGFANAATGYAATVAGGSNNTARKFASTSGGGWNCDALGQYATIPGGQDNKAGGDWSFAAGRYAIARHGDPASPLPEYSGDSNGDEGTFVWADSTHTSEASAFISTGPNQFLISAAGGVGIGTNAPTDPLTVNGAVRSMTGGFELPDGTIIDAAADLSNHFHNTLAASDGSPSNAVFVDAVGRVGIGTTSPDSAFQMDVSGSLASSGIRAFAAGSSSFAVNAINTGTGGTGVIGSAVFASGVTYGVRGNALSPSGFDFYAMGAGTDYGSASSVRWKRNIRPIDQPLEKLARMRGVYYEWDAEHGGHHDLGMIAEEVGAVLPEIVAYEENGTDAIGLDYGKLTPLLVEAVKAQSQQIADQQKVIDELTTRLERVERMIGAAGVREVK